MAKLIDSSYFNQITNQITGIHIDPTTDQNIVRAIVLSGVINKANIHSFQKQPTEKEAQTKILNGGPKVVKNTDEEDTQNKIKTASQYTPDQNTLSYNETSKNIIKSRVTIVGLDFNPVIKLELPLRPSILDYKPDLKLVGIATMGRNTSHYQYTGAEDSLELSIDWIYFDDYSREMAIQSARQIEAMAKNDGYKKSPSKVKLVWGDGRLFQNDLWVIAECPYQMGQFVDNNILANLKGQYLDRIIKIGLMPQRIIQNVLLKKISTHNLTSNEINFTNYIPENKIKKQWN